jgi:transcription-repair coupling factor (superfamily II helicase)
VMVKIKAEQAGLASIAVEGEQLVLRFPPLPEGTAGRTLPSLGGLARPGKSAYWMPLTGSEEEWRDRLMQTLKAIIDYLPDLPL